MFESIKKESPQVQELLNKILKYHFDWDMVEKTKNTKAKQVENWIATSVKEAEEKKGK